MKTIATIISPRSVAVKAYTRFSKRQVAVRFVVVGDADLADGARLDVQMVREKTGETLQRRTVRRLLGHPPQWLRFRMSDLDSGCCSFRAELIDRHGTRLPARVLYDKDPGAVAWLGSRAGITRTVPRPWTPLALCASAGGRSVACWGRSYEFARTPFLHQVNSNGHPLLAGPVRLLLHADGRDAALTGAMPRLARNDPARMVLSQTAPGGGLVARVRTEVEFDGMVRTDWSLESRRPIRVERLAAEIPLRPEHAKYFYCFPAPWGRSDNVGSIPRDGAAMAFRSFVWIGDEDRGLSWFSESDANWFRKDSERAVEILPRSGETVLRLNLITAPVTVVPSAKHASGLTGFGQDAALFARNRGVRGLRYTFGFQATPVKPVEKDAWDYRIFCINATTPGFRPPLSVSPGLLDRLVRSGVRTVVIFEYWTDAEGHARTHRAAELRRIVKACHARGLKVLLYFSFLISDLAPEWETFGKECVITPKGGYPLFHYLPQPEQSAWRVCLRSAWQDFLADGIARVMRDYDVDGVYLDGTEYPFGCCNTEHGCGASWPDGAITPTYPIFAVRSAMRRIHAAVRSRKPDGQVNIHNSTCMTIPTLAWATSYWDGEQFGHMERSAETRRVLPLDAFRAEFMGRQWGVPAEFLCYGKPFTFEEAWAFTLLHDVPVRPVGLDALPFCSAIWKVMEEFGRKEAAWLPYWSNAAFVSVSPKDVHASLYRHPRNGVLAVVSNLADRPAAVRLRLNLSRLGLSGNGAACVDALSRERLSLRGGLLDLRIPSMSFSLLRFQ